MADRKIRLTKAQKRAVAKIKEVGLVTVIRGQGNEHFAYPDGQHVDTRPIRKLIEKGVLKPQADGLFGEHDAVAYVVA